MQDWGSNLPTACEVGPAICIDARLQTPTGKYVPVASRAEPQETLLLLKCQGHDNFPELYDVGMLSRVASIILRCSPEPCKVQMRQPAHQQLQLVILKQPQRQAITDLHSICMLCHDFSMRMLLEIARMASCVFEVKHLHAASCHLQGSISNNARRHTGQARHFRTAAS